MAASTNAFGFKCVECKICKLVLYTGDGFAYFDAKLVFSGEHDCQSMFTGSRIVVDVSGCANLDDENVLIVESVVLASEEVPAYVDDFDADGCKDCPDDGEGYYLWANNEKVPIGFFD